MSAPPRAMILAAGLGTRLGTLSAQRPKPMLPVVGVPLVRWAVLWLRHHGVREMVVNLHHLGHLIEEELGDGRALGVDIVYSREEPEILGTGGALRHARAQLDDGSGRPIVVVNGKILVDLDLHDVLGFHRQHGAEATMVLRPDADAARWGSLRVDAAGRVTRLLDRSPAAAPDAPAHDEPLMFTGVHVLQPRFLDRIPPQGPQCVIRTAYAELFDRAEGLMGYVTRRYWWEHSTPERYLQGVSNVLRGAVSLPFAPSMLCGVHETAQVDPTAQLIEPVWVGAHARIGAGAVVGPDVQLGAHSNIAAGVSIERSIVWDGVTVAQGCKDAIVTGEAPVPLGA